MTGLSESQKQTILFGFLDVHRRMAEMEAMLAQSGNISPFSQHLNDLSPTESKVVQDYFARLRATMLDILHESDIPLQVRQTSLRWALQVGITFLGITVDELSPERLRGYGPLEATGATQAVKIQQGLRRLVQRLATYLHQGLGHDLPQRLARLEASRTNVGTLPLLERVITCWGLVEFRPQLDLIVRRLEAPVFEIAVFGRVSSGKSSLLNHVVGRDVLPVGVTPITAVPTRLVRGSQPAALISFAEAAQRTVPVEELRLYASEEGNPGNHQHVTEILVQLPAPRLREGIVLVDTPGIGSLAQSGSAETFAYLPHCDLGVVLIDAASTLISDDLDLLRLLFEAGIPAQVVLSKADLLAPADRQRAVNYMREHIKAALGLDVSAHPVSTVSADLELLTHWFEQEIEPLLARHRMLTEASLRRKIAHLHESVIASLQVRTSRHRDGPDGVVVDPGLVRRLLDSADTAIREAERRRCDWTAPEATLVSTLFQNAAMEVVAHSGVRADAADAPVVAALEQLLVQRGQKAVRLASLLQSNLLATLDSLSNAAPLAQIDTRLLRDVMPRGLPAVDLAAVQAALHCSRPWWSSLFRPLAVWASRRAIEKRFGAILREHVRLYDRQLEAWLKATIAQLVELYEAQAEVLREQVRRLATGDVEPDNLEALAADLSALTQSLSSPEQETEQTGPPNYAGRTANR
jgi:GTP-binding protein EngB required for normal cell division